MVLDLVTGNLLDTKNKGLCDEMKLVRTGFNIGHNLTAGIFYSTN